MSGSTKSGLIGLCGEKSHSLCVTAMQHKSVMFLNGYMHPQILHEALRDSASVSLSAMLQVGWLLPSVLFAFFFLDPLFCFFLLAIVPTVVPCNTRIYDGWVNALPPFPLALVNV